MLYSINLYVGIATSIYFALSIWVVFISLMQSVNGAQFFNITSLSLSPNCFGASSASASIIAIVPLTSVYALL